MTVRRLVRPPRRRDRWADRENARRRIRYATDLARWQRVDAELAALATTAGTFAGYPADRQPGQARLILRSEERMLGQVSRAALVRITGSGQDPPRGYGEYSALAASRLGQPTRPARSARRRGRVRRREVETGPVTVTDQRVVFHGALRDWEWSLGQLAGVWHGRDDPLTAIRVDDRAALTGLSYHRTQAPRLRFLVALAVARRHGTVDTLVRRLAADRAAHAAARPVPPDPVDSQSAPSGAAAALDTLRAIYLGRAGQPVRWRLAQFVAAMIATAGIVALVIPVGWTR